MFALAMEAKKRGMGVVGSTQNILDFIAAKLAEAVERPFPDTLQACSANLFKFSMGCWWCPTWKWRCASYWHERALKIAVPIWQCSHLTP